MSSTPSAPAPTSSPGSGWFAAVSVLLAVGIGVALYLTRLHMELFYGSGVSESLCDLGGNFSCSEVNAAPQSEIFGIPQSILAIPAYLVMGGLAAAAWRGHRGALGLLTIAGVATVLYSGYLAYLSAFVIGAWCLFCMTLYAVNLGVTGLAAWKARAGVGSLDGAWKVGLGAIVAFGVALAGTRQVYEGFRVELAAQTAAKAVKEQVATKGASEPDKAAQASTTNPDGSETKKVRLGDKRTKIDVPKDAPSLGPVDAKVQLVEFSDFQCPFCKRLSGTLRQLADEYPKDVRVVYLQFPLHLDCNRAPLKKSMHPDACSAAAAGVCANAQGKFWEMHDQLFEQQASLGRSTYLSIAKDLGLDRERFEGCLDDPATHDTIGAQSQLGGDAGVIGTPTFFINGREMSGAQPIEVLRAVVDAELAGQTGALDMDVKVGVEATGTVASKGDSIAVTALGGTTKIDAFEASLDGKKAVSRPGVEPARSVSWYDAKAACEAAGKRLCTEQEWLAACTGERPVDGDGNGVYSDETITGRRYGYGDQRKSGVCADSRNPDAVGELLTGNHPNCGTPDGIYDMIGGVKEWVGLTPGTAGLKGGSYSSGESARCGYLRNDIAPDTKDAANGFRCCEGPADVPPVKPGREVGEKLASFSVPLVDGGTFDTKKLAGKPTIVTFWASWCGPCKKELPALATLYTKYKDKGLDVLAVSIDSDESKLKAYLSSSPLPFRIGRDADGSLLQTFGNRTVPTSLWIKRDGTIRVRTTGLPPGGEKRLEELVNELMAG